MMDITLRDRQILINLSENLTSAHTVDTPKAFDTCADMIQKDPSYNEGGVELAYLVCQSPKENMERLRNAFAKGPMMLHSCRWWMYGSLLLQRPHLGIVIVPTSPAKILHTRAGQLKTVSHQLSPIWTQSLDQILV